jgi:hypothetical protein
MLHKGLNYVSHTRDGDHSRNVDCADSGQGLHLTRRLLIDEAQFDRLGNLIPARLFLR